MVSSFLRELPDELLHWITPRIAARSAFKPAYSSYPAAATADYAAPAPRPADPSGWRIGQNVEHAKFGEGVVLNVEGSGADARVQVKFRNTGSKWLSLEYAKLTAL
jgi:DNA helicase-2/ATP-dependent DNA helicase PcrA